MDFKTLKALNPAEFESAADGYRSVSNMAQHAAEALERQITANMRKDLKGEAREAALGQLSGLSKNFHYTQVQCGAISTALNGLAHDLREAKTKLNKAVQDAEDEGFTVNADGSVSYPAADDKDGKKQPGGSVTGYAIDKSESQTAVDDVAKKNPAKSIADQAANIDPNPKAARAQPIAHRIAQAVWEATEVDGLWAPQLRRLKADDDMVVSEDDWIDAKKDTEGVRKAAKDYLDDIKIPSKDSDPASNAKWWKGLSPDERDALISLRPASLGALDGLPAGVRDEANRTVLAEARAEYQKELSAIPEAPEKYHWAGRDYSKYEITDDWRKWNDKYGDRKKRLENAIDGMGHIQNRFDRTGEKGLPEAYLLGFDPFANHDGKVIIANGNPDVADHTAVYVPGSKTLLGNINDEMEKSEVLWRESTSLAPNQSVSTITWFDYDSPRSAKPFEAGDGLYPEASSNSQAAEGAPSLRQFLDGNVAAQQAATGDKAHNTLLGHSYGTTLMGNAADYSPDYHDSWTDPLPVDDVVTVASPGFRAKSPGDVGLDPHHFWAMASPDDPVPLGGRVAGLGEDGIVPTDREFGANIMMVDTKGHGDYWDYKGNEPSVSLTNQANVIVGAYDDVKLIAEAP
ncbi:alpha/beta hydrolase [Streptomyces sp. XD-27]|uniref:alpha/beta hydrolase n=1 Tax=Streptomyces sp. XD-27 TaxID=3062779 RepID=UPI0026F4683B|nr:alpha/beta hydrolase [Streptomyces sp. XD-27]WKX72405.1 alpha/beta hydrolase [Streptomyces sp. XD-27]